MKIFDYSFLKSERIDREILSLYIEIEKQQSLMSFYEQLYPQVFKNIQSIASFQSVKFSYKIDGITFTDINIDKAVLNKSNENSKNESAIAGYYNSLIHIFNDSSNIAFSAYSIRNMHSSLYGNIGSNEAGNYKFRDNLIIEKQNNGSQRVIFNPTSSEFTSRAIDDLVDAFNIAINDDQIPKLLLLPCVILDFMLIYPFENYNEVLSRLLTQLLLFKGNYDISKYVSFEKQLYYTKSDYYDSIIKSSINWDDNKNNYDTFILHFLNSLYSCYNELSSRFKIVKGEKVNKKKRIEETIMKSFEPISRKEIHLIWPDISQETIKKVVKDLLTKNKIKKIGNFKDARYKRNWYGDRREDEENIVIF